MLETWELIGDDRDEYDVRSRRYEAKRPFLSGSEILCETILLVAETTIWASGDVDSTFRCIGRSRDGKTVAVSPPEESGQIGSGFAMLASDLVPQRWQQLPLERREKLRSEYRNLMETFNDRLWKIHEFHLSEIAEFDEPKATLRQFAMALGDDEDLAQKTARSWQSGRSPLIKGRKTEGLGGADCRIGNRHAFRISRLLKFFAAEGVLVEKSFDDLLVTLGQKADQLR